MLSGELLLISLELDEFLAVDHRTLRPAPATTSSSSNQQ
jgi:hypothetical protein